jgi:hypothetical protein
MRFILVQRTLVCRDGTAAKYFLLFGEVYNVLPKL